MKISIICTAFLTALSVEAVAIAGQDECFTVGGPCNTLKRAAEAVADYGPHDRQSHRHQCWTDGAMCFKDKRDLCGAACLKAKRDALALAEAVAEAAPFADLDRRHCNSNEGPCSRAKRNTADAAEALALAEAHADPDAQDDAGADEEIVRRTAKAAAEAIADYGPHDRQSHRHQCWINGAMCFKAKRALDGLSGVVNSIL